MGHKRKAEEPPRVTVVDKVAQDRSAVPFAGLPASEKDVRELLPKLLESIRCYHRAQGTSVNGSATVSKGVADPLLPCSRPQDSSTHEEVLMQRLEQVRRLKSHYQTLYHSFLSHLPPLASCMRATQHSILTRPEEGSSAQSSKKKRLDQASGCEATLENRSDTQAFESCQPGTEAAEPSSLAPPKQSQCDETMPTFTDVEDAAISTEDTPDAIHKLWSTAVPLPDSLKTALKQRADLEAGVQAVANSLDGYADHERIATYIAATDMDRHQACAVLCGRRKRFYLHNAMVLIGRDTSSKGEARLFVVAPHLLVCSSHAPLAPFPMVDVDLTLEGPSTKLSRRQCLLELDMRYGFVLRNIGRQVVWVNNVEVKQGFKIKVPHMSLLEMGGLRLLFVSNLLALQRVAEQPGPCPKSLVGPS